MRPEQFDGLELGLAGLLLPIAEAGFPEHVTALPWWKAETRARGLALLAFAAELASIPDKVTEPVLGAARYAFWREVAAEAARGEARAHPVAQGLVAAHLVPVPLTEADMLSLIDAAEEGLPEVQGAVAPPATAFRRTMFRLLGRLAGEDNEKTLQQLGYLGEAIAAQSANAAWDAAWQALLPLPERIAPIAAAARLEWRRRQGRRQPALRQKLSLFLTVLSGR